MTTRTLGQGLEASATGLGRMGMSQSFGPDPGDRDEMIAVLRAAVDRGVTLFDTAEVYGSFVNEQLTDRIQVHSARYPEALEHMTGL